MHPTFKQVPPKVSYFSTKAVFIPNWAHLMAATYPPGPDPITITSYILLNIFNKGKNTTNNSLTRSVEFLNSMHFIFFVNRFTIFRSDDV